MADGTAMADKVQRIDNWALAILESVGIRLHNAEVLTLLADHGVRIEGRRAFFLPDQIRSWVAQAPDTFTLHARNPVHDMVIGGDHVHMAAGYGCAAVLAEDGRRRDATLDDYVDLAKLVHQCDSFKINGGILVQPTELPAEWATAVMLYAALTHSDKCLLGIPGHAGQMQAAMDMAAIAFGGREALLARPRVLTMISTLSPLQLDAMALESILVAARHRQPVILSPGPATGTTGPIDMAANLALATAEALAGIAITQIIQPGNPVVFGLQCYGADLRTGNIAIGSPAYALQARYTAALARHYGLPSRCGGAVTDARSVGVQAGYESMMAMLTAQQNGVNLIIHAAGILDRFATISVEKFLVDVEIIARVKYYLGDLPAEEEHFNLDLIREVGSGGQFLTTRDTMHKCRSHPYAPAIGAGTTGDGPAAEAAFGQSLARRRQSLLDNYERPGLDPALKTELDRFMQQLGVDEALLLEIHPSE